MTGLDVAETFRIDPTAVAERLVARLEAAAGTYQPILQALDTAPGVDRPDTIVDRGRPQDWVPAA